MTFQILIFCLALNLAIFLITLPDYIRHQTDPEYTRYDSFWDFFKTDVLEAIVTATCFSVVIPLLDIYIKKALPSSKK